MGVGLLKATLINAGNPTVFFEAESPGLTGTEMQEQANGDLDLLRKSRPSARM
jgi:2-methylaconitate cis-trans-isomerase PrpF